MDGEANGAQTQGEEQQGIENEAQVGDIEPQSQQQTEEVVGEDEYRAVLADRDAKIEGSKVAMKGKAMRANSKTAE